jgi:hypothetical protein
MFEYTFSRDLFLIRIHNRLKSATLLEHFLKLFKLGVITDFCEFAIERNFITKPSRNKYIVYLKLA